MQASNSNKTPFGISQSIKIQKKFGTKLSKCPDRTKTRPMFDNLNMNNSQSEKKLIKGSVRAFALSQTLKESSTPSIMETIRILNSRTTPLTFSKRNESPTICHPREAPAERPLEKRLIPVETAHEREMEATRSLEFARPDSPKRLAKDANTGISDYIIGRQIGRGAYSVVRLAVFKPENTQVAIKSYDKAKLQNSRFKQNILREVNLLKNINHRHVINFIDKIETSSHYHIVTEYVKGKTLSVFLKTKPSKRLSEDEARRVFKQIANGVAYCHAHNITHRDLKLDNVLITDVLEVKIIDFGFSTCNAKRVKVFCGTPNYMAPEVSGKTECAGSPTDIWSLGVMLYYMLCGAYPFKGADEQELYRKTRMGQFVIPGHVSPKARHLMVSMLKVNPEERLTAEEILEHSWFDSHLSDFIKRRPSMKSSLETEEGEYKWINFDWSPTALFP